MSADFFIFFFILLHAHIQSRGERSLHGASPLVIESQASDEKCGFLHYLAEGAGPGR